MTASLSLQKRSSVIKIDRRSPFCLTASGSFFNRALRVLTIFWKRDRRAVILFFKSRSPWPTYRLIRLGKNTFLVWQYLPSKSAKPYLSAKAMSFLVAFPFSYQSTSTPSRLSPKAQVSMIRKWHVEISRISSILATPSSVFFSHRSRVPCMLYLAKSIISKSLPL